MKTFEQFLQEEHAKVSTAFDDDMPDAFNYWLEKLDVDELIQFGEAYGKEMRDLGRREEYQLHQEAQRLTQESIHDYV